MKKTDKREVFNYETYLTGKSFNVPKYYGKYVDENDVWILIENINGEDLRNMTNKLAILSADSISKIQNSYWQDNEQEFALYKSDCRFEVYWKRINKRFLSIKNHPILRDAYQIFLDRQLSCPRTLSNGDFLEFNVVKHNNQVSIIDWGFGGIMPYSLDIARFIAHATEDRATFPFYMNEKQKQLFIKRVYEKLEKKPDYSQYIFDIKLAILNEYIEFIEADEDDDQWYYNHALKLAEDILENNNVSYSYK
ncbi:phosphotransferase [uncultured Clostridium sp.]|uniref:phosphotransferase n=1 Tax=uncultured Clostridium sp. TaxID=59620 RepID=UPI0025E6710B|nr:phosphotransferase [uncultured Clostridium sp.]